MDVGENNYGLQHRANQWLVSNTASEESQGTMGVRTKPVARAAKAREIFFRVPRVYGPVARVPKAQSPRGGVSPRKMLS
jgi:hypothetical protein